jgi:hypothetical protein
MYYIGQPYSHKDPEVREQRFKIALKVLQYFISINEPCFSPIVQTHHLESKPSNYWMTTDLALLRLCDKLLVLKIEGWEKSVGLAKEIEEAKKIGMPIQEVFWDEEQNKALLGDYLFLPDAKNDSKRYSSLNNYQQDAHNLSSYSRSIPMSIYPVVALSGEVGEILNKFKKILGSCPETNDLQKVSCYIKEKVYENLQNDFNLLKNKIAKNKEADLITFKNEIRELLEMEICTRYFYEKGQVEARFDDDKELAEAIKILKEPKRYQEILKKK